MVVLKWNPVVRDCILFVPGLIVKRYRMHHALYVQRTRASAYIAIKKKTGNQREASHTVSIDHLLFTSHHQRHITSHIDIQISDKMAQQTD